MKSPRLILALMAYAHLATAQLPAQGPRPLGLQQPAPAASSANRRDIAPTRFDTTHVKPNHWKRGARIGFLAVAVPTAALLIGADCDPYATPGVRCVTAKAGLALGVGVAGAPVGGFVGTFFPK